jgi:acetolactate decarboxylase
MIRPMIWRALALAVFAAGAPPAHAAEVYQVSTISSLLAGGYDGDTSVAELLRHGGFGLGTFNGVDGEMMVLDGRVYRGTVDGHAHAVADSALTPFAVVVAFRPQGSAPVAAGQSLEQLGGARCAALQRVARPCGAGRRAFSNDRGAQRAQTAASLSPLARSDQSAAGRAYLR